MPYLFLFPFGIILLNFQFNKFDRATFSPDNFLKIQSDWRASHSKASNMLKRTPTKWELVLLT